MSRFVNPLAADLDEALVNEALWRKLTGARIFITGGTGFFGSWLLETLLWANDRLSLKAEAVVLSRDPGAFAAARPRLANHEAIKLVQGDIRTFEFPQGPFSHMIHAATEASAALNLTSPIVMIDTIVDGTRRALEFARERGVKKLLFTSSGAVYGRQPSELTHVSEDYPGAPDVTDARSAYGEGKRLAELLCVLYATACGLEPKIARCFAFNGPYLPLDRQFAVGNFLRDALGGGPVRVGGDGTPYRSYLYASDLAVWLWSILLEGKPCRPYNVGSDADLTVAELASTVARVAGGCKVEVAGKPGPGQKPERYVPSVARAKTELGLRETVGLEEGLRRTVAFLKA